MTDEILNFLREKFARLYTRLDAMQNDLQVAKNDIRIMKEDIAVTASTLHRLDSKQDVLLIEVRTLYPQINQMRGRIDVLEHKD
jgi:chromosome segregation ATPase